MNIVHIDFTGPFTDGFNYQENILPAINVAQGHNVTFIATVFKWENGIETEIVNPCDYEYCLDDGVRIIRKPFKRIFSKFISKKVRAVNGLFGLLEGLKPDVIMVHSLQTWELLTVAKYKMAHPHMKFYCDSHTDYYTSGTSWMSLNILHKIFYSVIIHKALKYIDRILYISINCGKFLEEVYHIGADRIEFYPLGGLLLSDSQRERGRVKIRGELGIDEQDILLVHAGKLDKSKRTLELVDIFSRNRRTDLKLVLVGSLSADIEKEVMSAIQSDRRISYVGWKSGYELREYFSASDVYVQPGKVSANAQMAICSHASVILNNFPDYEPFVCGNGYLINDVAEMAYIFDHFDKKEIEIMQEKSFLLAQELLDYEELAKRLYV